MDADSAPPPRSAPNASPTPSSRGAVRISGRGRSAQSALAWVLGVGVLLVLGGAVVLFTAGDHLFGSDPATIDSYNQEVLDSCQIPDDSTLVQVSIRPVIDEAGPRYRSMWYVYASPLPVDEVAEFFGVHVERSMLVSPRRACRFEQRPSVLVLPAAVAGEPATGAVSSGGDLVPTYDGLWADQVADVTLEAEVPVGTESLFRLRIAQRETEGVF
mgnify:CR=1 FL=1